MTKKVAVASTDGKVVNAHFGRASQFLIFEMTDDTISFIELRENKPGCSQLNEPIGTMEETLALISDCQYVLVAKIGKPMKEVLLEAGLVAIEAPGMIEDELMKI